MKTETSVAASLDGPGPETAVVRRVEGPAERERDAVDVDLSYAAVREAESAGMALSPGQRKAIERLTSGSTAVEAATAAGVGRSTIYRWMKEDPAFIAAYNAWQRDLLATARGKMLALTDVALVALGKALGQGDGKLALRVLEKMGIAERPTPGETDVEELKRQQAMAARTTEMARRKAEVELAGEEEDLRLREMLKRGLGS